MIDHAPGGAAPDPPRTLYERLEPVIGKAKGLPPDAAQNVDHYLHGHPTPPTDDAQTLYDRLKPVIGQVHGLPPDLAENHDHYLHGRPKK